MCNCNSGISGLGDWGDWAGEYTPDTNDFPGAGQQPITSWPSGGGNNGGWGNSNGSWLNVLTAGIKGATGILGTRYAVPQLNPGQLIQTGPNGQSLMYQGTAGNMSIPSLNSLGGSGVGGMLPLLAVGAVVLFMMKK